MAREALEAKCAKTYMFYRRKWRDPLFRRSGEGDTHDLRSLSTKDAPRQAQRHHGSHQGPFTNTVRTPFSRSCLGNNLPIYPPMAADMLSMC